VTLFDYGVLALVAASALLGLWRGIASELLALVAWVVAFFCARALAVQVSVVLTGVIAEPGLRYGAAFAAIFFGVLLVLSLGRLLVREILKSIGLGLVDRLLGAVFGLLRGAVLVLVAVLLGGLTTLPKQSWWQDAVLAPPLELVVLAGKPWMPQELAKRIRYR
jgi:membrane protein required for colicin V production